MVKRTLVEYITNKLSYIPKEKVYQIVFDDDKDKIELYFSKNNLWIKFKHILDNLSVIDPACGSGAFLVGMLNVLSSLYKVTYKHLKIDLTDFEIKNRIIMMSLYGVDVMPWAVHAAELRLWLQLIVESDIKKEDTRRHPLLPNLNINLRVGDSLVQSIGGINLNIRNMNISEINKKRLAYLKQEKLRYSNNDPLAEFKEQSKIQKEQTSIFEAIIHDRIRLVSQDVKRMRLVEKADQKDLFGNTIEKNSNHKSIKNLEKAEKELSRLKEISRTLHDSDKRPFVWDIDFAEIFGEKGGFDIVIGNPPYVSIEKIAPPNLPQNEVSNEDKNEYKEELIKSVNDRFPTLRLKW